MQSSDSQQVFWLKGSLGSGKTTISYTVAKLASEHNLLGANFFFSRFDESLRDPRLLFPTIAFHLAQGHPTLRLAIAEAVSADADITHRQPAVQFDALIRQTMSTLTGASRPMIFVFDALDEFEDGIGSFQDIMQLFIHRLAELSSNIRIFVTSRPEPYIGRLMRLRSSIGLKVHDLDVDPESQRDMWTYLRHELLLIPQRLGLEEDYDADWFSDVDLQELVRKSGTCFVYAATVLRFIGDPIACDPRQQLDLILRHQFMSDSHPYSNVDKLYLFVLQRAYPEGTSEDKLDKLRSVFALTGIIKALYSTQMIAHFASCEKRDVNNAVHNLSALFSLSYGHCQLHHQDSMRDFLTSRIRCRDGRFLWIRTNTRFDSHFSVYRQWSTAVRSIPVTLSTSISSIPMQSLLVL
ncbi:hypothetical protein HGRIS_013117 [Hohenbuehelia grisea]|uniref:Nephrocystin 3-like N-terminal domain-containing protein n=1 Tax=Hohenbuehelia grisea TaxID=104357 RepID=A0ABR3IUM8_9AGAR